MNLKIIKSKTGQAEYVLLPIDIYLALQKQIDKRLQKINNDYVPFVVEDYVDNPVALARIKANVTQSQLAAALKVSQAYISKLERQENVTAKVLTKVNAALESIK